MDSKKILNATLGIHTYPSLQKFFYTKRECRALCDERLGDGLPWQAW